MKQYLILLFSLVLFSCSSDSDEPIREVSVKIKFTQNWDGTTIEKSDLDNKKFTNKLGTKLTIKELKYLTSRIKLTNGSGKIITLTEKEKFHKLVDINNPESLLFDFSEKISEGTYNLSMTFGFNNDDNYSQIYTDLANWTVSDMLGGGYHYMQLEGKFLNKDIEQQGFTYHTIRAVDKTDPNNLKFKDSFFLVDLGTINLKNNATIEIKMNVASWFKVGLMKDPEDENLLIKDPKGWDLNGLHENLMGNFDAQKQMSENGKSGVFSLGTVSQ